MSDYDQCLWYGDNIMVVQYVDDCGISAPTQDVIDQFVRNLRGLGFKLTQEGLQSVATRPKRIQVN